MNNQTPNAMTIAQLCAWANISRSKAYDEIANGRLKALKLGRKTLVTRDDAIAWFQALPSLVSRAS